jgi:hypothetical protein
VEPALAQEGRSIRLSGRNGRVAAALLIAAVTAAILVFGNPYATRASLNEAALRGENTLRLAVSALRGHMRRYEALPLLIAVWAWFALPESARWLATSGRIDEADALVRRMEDEAIRRGRVLDEPEPVPPTPVEAGRLRLAEVFSTTYRARTFSLATLWITSFFIVYGSLTWLPTMYVSVGQLPPANSLALTVVLGAIQLGVGSLLGSLLDRTFDGSVLPLSIGFLGYGVVALVLVLVAERGQLFQRIIGAEDVTAR